MFNLPPAIQVVNGTHIVPLYFPTTFQPDQLDKLGWTAIITLTWPSIIAGFALIAGTRDWRRVSSAQLSSHTMLSNGIPLTPLVLLHITRHRLVLVCRACSAGCLLALREI